MTLAQVVDGRAGPRADLAVDDAASHLLRSKSDKHYFAVGLVLSFVGGFADAGSFVVADSFTGHITGNMLLMAVYLANSRYLRALSCLLAVVAFLAGTAGGSAWPSAAGRPLCQRLAPIIAVEIPLIGFGMVFPVLHITGRRDVLLASLCLALGLQNGALGKIGSVEFHTTFITGMATTVVGSLVSRDSGAKQRLLPVVIGVFILGAFCGAFAAVGIGIASFTVLLVLLAVALVTALTAPSE